MFVKQMNERTSGVYTATIVDAAQQPVPGSNLEQLTLTLYDLVTKAVINSRNAQNVLNTNGVTVDGNGLLTWTIAPADNPIITAGKLLEAHRAVFHGTWASGSREYTYQMEIQVTNLYSIPTAGAL